MASAVYALLCSVVYSPGGMNGWPVAHTKLCVRERQLLWLRACWKFLLSVFMAVEGPFTTSRHDYWAHGNTVTCLRWPIRCPFLMS